MVTASSGMRSTSSRWIVTSGSASTSSVIRRANSPRSTASALPAGTRTESATRMISDPIRRISSFSSPAAWSSALPRRLFEHTSSARSPVWCTGVWRTGRISWRSTRTPRRASCQDASLPARPPPTIVTRCVMSPAYRGRRSAPSGRFAPVVTGLVAAEDDLAFLLGLLLEEIGAAAVRAGLGKRTVIRGELALGVSAAPVERAPPAPLPLDDLALPAFGARQADLLRFLLLDVLAVRVVAAGDEGPEPAPPPHEVLGALRALLLDGCQDFDLQLAALAADEALGDLA